MQQVIFPGLLPHFDTHVRFDTANLTSDGCVPLLKACDQRLGLSSTLAACLSDARSSDRILHSLTSLLRQHIFGIALGYEDCNDAARLRQDPALKLCLDRAPVDGPDLASQPTLSRFENSVSQKDLLRMGQALCQTVLDRLQQRHPGARTLTIDCDPTCDPTHGQQQLSLFNGFYGTHCYLPLITPLLVDNDPEHYLVSSLLRAGNAPAKKGLVGMLKRLLPELRQRFPRAQLRIRLDSGFQGGELLDWLRKEGVQVVVGLAKNKVLERLAQPWAERSRAEWAEWQESQKAYEAALLKRRQALQASQAAGPHGPWQA